MSARIPQSSILILWELSSSLTAINTVGTFTDVENGISLALVDNYRHMRAAKPVVRYYAVWAHRIGSCKFERSDVRARHSSKKLPVRPPFPSNVKRATAAKSFPVGRKP